MKTPTFLYILGRESQLSYTEIAAFLASRGYSSPVQLSDQLVAIAVPDTEINAIIRELGGWVKIARCIATVKDDARIPQAIERFLAKYETQESRKITYAISYVLGGNRADERSLIGAIKQWFEEKSINSRYLFGKQLGLSSVQVKTQGILKNGFELLIAYHNDTVCIYKTEAVQDYKLWITHDYGRPYANPLRGMVPPKLARMMVIIARSFYETDRASSPRTSPYTLLDPFCGEGTILQEGLAVGMQVLGSDIDQKAVSDTQKNLEWFKNRVLDNPTALSFAIKQADIRKLTTIFKNAQCELIITEPFLGTPAKKDLTDFQKQAIKRSYTPLFIALLEQSHELLKDGGVMGVVVPTAQKGRFSQRLLDKSVLDSCEKFGYTLLAGPIMYSRPDAKIGRELYYFRRS